MGTYEGVFLDFYGTVAAGDAWAVEDLCRRVIDDHGLSVTALELAGRWGDRYFEAIEHMNGHGFRLLGQIERDTLIETLAAYGPVPDVTAYVEHLNAYLARPPLFEEVREVLARLELPVCIVSNADEYELRTAIAYHGLPLETVVTSESARCYKPDAGIFRHALKVTGWPADRVLHVGDSLHSDVGGAHTAGLKAAWVHRVGRIKDIGTETPEHTWTDLWPLLTV